jgi:protease-4
MKGRVVVTALLVTLSSWAWPHLSTSAGAESASLKTPTTGPSDPNEFPSPAELMKKLKAEKDLKAKQSKVAFFDLSQAVEEKPAEFSLFGDEHLTTHTLIERLRQARNDKNVKAVLITLGESGLNLSQAQEIRNGLLDLKKAGKPSFVYADSYDTVGYTIASGASDACMLEGGEIMIPGVGMETMFYKGLMDKVGVKADYIQIGEYKGADEEYTRTGPSDELKGELSRLTDALYEQIVEGISSSRNISRDSVKQTIDETILTGKNAKDRGFIDHLIDQDGLRELITKKLGNDIAVLNDYGAAPREGVDFSNPLGMLQALTKKPEKTEPAKPSVALIYAEGVIQDGEVSASIFGGNDGIGSADMRRALRMATRDDNVKAIVIRIDSPGGSALASEVMWQAVRRVAAKKPVIISVGSMAASGGYYLASAGDRIFADNTAIVGSIGVVGGKFVLKDLFEKLGLHTETFSRGRNAGLFSQNEPWTDRQRTMVTSWMKETYDQFTQRVMTTRQGKIKDIDAVARGRIFLARQAKELGMVDEIGGIDDALAYAAKRSDLEAGKYDVKVLPAPKTLADYLNGSAAAEHESAAFPFQPKVNIGADSLLQALSPQLRKELSRELQMVQLLQDRPVILVAPYTLTVK